MSLLFWEDWNVELALVEAGIAAVHVEESLPVPTKKADKNCLPDSDGRRAFALLISIYL